MQTSIIDLESFSVSGGLQFTGAVDADGWVAVEKDAEGDGRERMNFAVEDIDGLMAMLDRLKRSALDEAKTATGDGQGKL